MRGVSDEALLHVRRQQGPQLIALPAGAAKRRASGVEAIQLERFYIFCRSVLDLF